MQQKGFNARKGLHRVGHAGGPQRVAPVVAVQRLTRQVRIARLRHVHAAHAVAPDHEAGSAADPGDVGHDLDGQAIVGGVSRCVDMG